MSAAPTQLVVFGAQGAGKGTQAARLAETYDLQVIGAGDILRKIATEDTPLGRKVQGIVSAGQLVSDDMISEIYALQIQSLPKTKGFVIEGYPRTVNQSEQLRANLDRLGRPADRTVFICLDAPREELIKRLLARGRHDDTEALIEERLRLYDQETAPVLAAVESWATVLHVNGNQPIEAVTEEIINHLNDVKAKA